MSSHLHNVLEPSPDIEESNKRGTFMSELGSGDHTRMKMKTRVAVRDKNPHRFQVVPLRDITKLQAALSQIDNNSNHLSASVTSGNYLVCSPSTQFSSYSRPRQLSITSSLNSVHSFGGRDAKENRIPESLPEKAQKLDSRNGITARSSVKLQEGISTALPEVSSISNLETIEKRKEPPSPSEDNSILTIYSERISTLNAPSQPSQQRTHAKFASLSNLLGSYSSFQFTTPKKRRHSRKHKARHSDAAACITGKGFDPPTTPDGRKKRHAIYPPSLFLPYLKKDSFEKEEGHLLSSLVDGSTSSPEMLRYAPEASVNLESDKTLRQSHTIFDYDSDEDQIVTATVLEDPFLVDKSLSSNLSSQPANSGSSVGQQKPATVEPNEATIVYSKIILDLFSEVDAALAEWDPVYWKV